MKVLSKLIFFFCLAFTYSAEAQQTVEGSVTNHDKKPLESVTLILKDTSGKILSFSRTNEKGAFKIALNGAIGKFTLELTSIGYKKKIVQNVEAGKPVQVQLETDAQLLKDVVVKNRPVLRNHGDTLDYNPADFANKDDRSIGDVIRKMPGLTMDEAGKIEYNGKAISKFYIDKDNILDDKYNIGANAIPHSAVDKLQVIENDQPIKMLRKHNMSDDVALNLVLKKEARINMMGDMKLGAGLPKKYDGDVNAMLFKKSLKFINNLKVNNIGSDPGTDITSHNFAKSMSQSDNAKPASFLNAGAGGVPVLPQRRTLFNRAGLINLNNLVKWNDEYQLKINAAYFTDRRTVDYSRLSAIYLPGDTVRFSENQYNVVRPQKLETKIELIGNAEKYYIKNALSFNLNGSNTNSALITNQQPAKQYLEQQTLDFTNEFNFRKMLGTRNSFSANSLVSKTSLSENLDLDPGINEDLFNHGNPYESLFQNLTMPTWFSSNSLSFTRANTIAQTYQVSHVFQHQQLETGLFKVITKDPVPVEGNTTNDLDWKYSKLGFKALFEYKTDKITSSLNLPVSLNNYKYEDEKKNIQNKEEFFNFDPSFNIKFQSGIENYVSGSYLHSTSTGTIEDIYAGAILRNYRSLVLNDAPLSRRNTDRISASFNFKKALKMFFWNIGSSYGTIHANTISSYTIEDDQEKRIAVPLDNQIRTFSVSTSTSKYLFDLTTTVNAGANYSLTWFDQLQNEKLFPFKGRSLALNVGINTKFSKNINAEYDVKYNTSQSFSEGKRMRAPFHQFQHQLALNLNNLKDFRFNISGQYLYTQQPLQESLNYIFADANVVYTLKKLQTDLVLNITNIGNIRKFEAINLSANSYTSGIYQIPARMAIVSARFFFK